MFSLSDKHTFGLSASCKRFVSVSSIEQLAALFKDASLGPFYFLGSGSNSVFIEDFDGLVIHNNIKGKRIAETDSAYQLAVNSGENWHELVCYCLELHMHGFENLALIPGTVGAAPIQNIGAYGVELEQFVTQVDYLDIASGTIKHLTKAQCQFGYRDSIFKHALYQKAIITCVHFELPKAAKMNTAYAPLNSLQAPSPQTIFDCVVKVRQEKLPDPAILGNAGSFFKNPVVSVAQLNEIKHKYPDVPSYPIDNNRVKIPAAWLIDTLGFKGKQRDGVRCHEKQALVLVNAEQGSGSGVLSLARDIQSSVYEEFVIKLENEVRLIGSQGLIDL